MFIQATPAFIHIEEVHPLKQGLKPIIHAGRKTSRALKRYIH